MSTDSTLSVMLLNPEFTGRECLAADIAERKMLCDACGLAYTTTQHYDLPGGLRF